MIVVILTAEFPRHLKPYMVKAKPIRTELGSGTYDQVIEPSSAAEIVAGKVFKASSNIHQQTLTAKLFGELSPMAKLHHPNIVKVLLSMSSLHTYLVDPTNSNVPLVRKLSILVEVGEDSHQPAIIHRDLTANNVLLDPEHRAKISDFGIARIMEVDPMATPGIYTGTPDNMPPEAQGDSAKFDPSLDVFSFGQLSLIPIIQSPVHPLQGG